MEIYVDKIPNNCNDCPFLFEEFDWCEHKNHRHCILNGKDVTEYDNSKCKHCPLKCIEQVKKQAYSQGLLQKYFDYNNVLNPQPTKYTETLLINLKGYIKGHINFLSEYDEQELIDILDIQINKVHKVVNNERNKH